MPPKYKTTREQRKQLADNTLGFIPPQDLECEKVVLGALLIDKYAYVKVYDSLKPESFYDPRNQKVYAAICELSTEGSPVDIVTVTDRLQKNGHLDEAGGPGYVMELSSRVASSANIEYHANVVAQKSLLRQLVSFGSEVYTGALAPTADVDEVMQFAEGKLFEIASSGIKREMCHVWEAVKESNQKMMRAFSNKGELTGIPTGYIKLDENTNGWQDSDFIVVAGRPAMGKTSFALCLLKNAAVDYNIPTAFFSLEMSKVQLADRLISNVTQIETEKIQYGQLSEEELSRYDKIIPSLMDAPIYIDDTQCLSIMEFMTKARRVVREHGVKLIMIDYLQLMNANGLRFSSRQEEVSLISRSLKGLAKELNIPVIALSQLNRGVEAREGVEGKRPQLSDLRESGAIEQDADMVIFVHRPDYYRIEKDGNGNDLRGLAQIIIAKNRKGATGDVLLTFRAEFTRFENPEDKRLSCIPEANGYTPKTPFDYNNG